MPSLLSCLIIGGGISGLIAARVLQERQILTTVLDKGKGIGGRLATRRIAANSGAKGVFDYGAPHFQATDPRFQDLVDEWLRAGLVKEWCWGFPDLTGAIQESVRGAFPQKNRPYYCGIESNRSIAAYLAQGLDVRTGTRVIKLEHKDGIWIAIAENGGEFHGDVAIVTAPVPQSVDLLDSSQISIPSQIRERLEKISYSRCLAVLALLERESQIPEPGGLRGDSRQVLSWLCCHQKRGISPEVPAVTILATPEFSLTNWDENSDLVAHRLLDAAQPWLGADVIRYQVHGWKFSQPETFYGEPYAALTAPGLVILAGDAFSEQRNVEGAVLSGLAAGEYAADVLGKSSISLGF